MKKLFRAGLTWLLAMMVALPLPGYPQGAPAPEPFKAEEIEQLVAPIALYPDPLIAQILMASTYPLEIVQAARWTKQNPKVTGKALEDALQQQTWDPSVKSLAAFPQVLTMLNEKLDMTQKLGDAFLGQQKEVMAAIQKLRGKAQAAGNLKSSKEQTVSSGQEGGTTVIKIEPANPEVVYVPTYNPTAVYGPWPYPAYPPYAYYPPGYVPGAALFTFGVGMAVGAALWGGCNWGGGNVNVNVNKYNNFNKTNIQNSNWQHNAEHRKGTQYRDGASQQKYGGGQRQGADSREAFRGRAEQGRQEISRGGDQMKRDVAAADRSRTGDRGGAAGDRGGDRAGGAGDRAGGAGDRAGGAGDRAGGAGDRAGGAGDRAGGAGDRAGGAGDRGGGVGDRSGGATQRTGGASAFDGAGRSGGAQTRDASSRGASSRASAGGGGGARGGGGGGGGGRGGGRR